MNREAIAQLITKHEGMRNVVYLDTEGIMTIGVGFNLERKGAQRQIEACGANYGELCNGMAALTPGQVDILFSADLDDAIEGAVRSVPSFNEQPDDVQHAIVDMVFNLGVTRFQKFVTTIACLDAHDYCGAATAMRQSKWATQVPNRANEDIELVKQFCLPGLKG